MRERVEWGEGWENRGTRWIDHPLLRDAGVVGCWIVAYISSLVLLVFQQYFQTHKPTMESTTILPEPLVEEMAAETLDEGVDVKAGVLDSVVRLVAVSQQLDNRISRSLGGIREVENVGLGLGLYVVSHISSCPIADDHDTAPNRNSRIHSNLPSRIGIASVPR